VSEEGKPPTALAAGPLPGVLRLTLVVCHLGMGGSERVASLLANHAAARGWKVSLLTLDDGSEEPFFSLDEGVSRFAIGGECPPHPPGGGWGRALCRSRLLCRAIRSFKPHVVISFGNKANVEVLLATVGLRVPVIISERAAVGTPHDTQIGLLWRTLRWLLYPRAKSIVAQTERSRLWFPHRLQARCRVIPNPVIGAGQAIREARRREGQQHIVCALGRLHAVKGFDLLLHSFAKVSNKHPDWRLIIWGEGLERPRLEALRTQLGLENRATLGGATTEPFKALRSADLFVLSSRSEGFPNALCEAMACGLPAIAFDCSNGPAEIIRPGTDGLLVPADDVPALAAAMDRLMTSEPERLKLARRAPEVMRRFGIKRVLRMWDETIREALSLEAQEYENPREK
jgi:GalNAc-alpha-(1->4)-GalNAc-alpha-(1->3)-diNAcBac-PP-undecaprenol alpha-1,4-N-acetyl-D-galactosaminyltransferase